MHWPGSRERAQRRVDRMAGVSEKVSPALGGNTTGFNSPSRRSCRKTGSHRESKCCMQFNYEPTVATLTGFEPYLATSRYCAIVPQIHGKLRIIYRARNWPFRRLAQNYAVPVSEIVRKILAIVSALLRRRVFGSADHSGADRTSDRDGATPA